MPGHRLPVLALVGRPNVGKSTLFNALTRSRDALVADTPGLTRDRQYGFGQVGHHRYIVVDTGGLTEERRGLAGMAAQQTLRALEEADAVAFLVDATSGLNAADEDVVTLLRRLHKPVYLVVNKAEGRIAGEAAAEFYALGLGEPFAVSALRGRGLTEMVDSIYESWPDAEEAEDERPGGIRVAVVGRPNVGKSTLINRLLGEERVLASEEPGTTRDSVVVPFTRDGVDYTLVDTAGVRRRARVHDAIEKFSVVKTMQAMDQATVVVVLMDARQGVSAQDTRLLGLVVERGRALVVGVNKWDGLAPDERERVRDDLDFKLRFLTYVPVRFLSARHGTGVGELMQTVEAVHHAGAADLPTPRLTRVLQDAVEAHAPPAVHGRRIKLRYAHQGGSHPPRIVIHGNQTQALPAEYKRYLENAFRSAFQLQGTPIELEFRTGENPYEGRRNQLTPRQQRRHKRLLRHVKK